LSSQKWRNTFAAESQSVQNSFEFSRIAWQGGSLGIARLFLLVARTEKGYAEAHLRSMDGIWPAAHRLQAAFDGETYET
jgi:rubrerythrin